MEPPETERSARSPQCTVEISDTQAFVTVDVAGLCALAQRVLGREGIERAEVSVALVDNATIEPLNLRHLGHAGPTDVLSFALSEPGEGVLAGELVISAEMAAARAHELQIDPAAELALYVVHGLLHLCGYDDHTASDVDLIRRREAEHMAAEGLTYTYPLVVPAEPGDAEREPLRCSG
jgi:probable rRNA maturation factor